jgi:hypothetical protein
MVVARHIESANGVGDNELSQSIQANFMRIPPFEHPFAATAQSKARLYSLRQGPGNDSLRALRRPSDSPAVGHRRKRL